MKPTMSILDYLWQVRNTWLKHDEECQCPFERLSTDYLETHVMLDAWCEVVVIDNKPTIQPIYMTYDEWDERAGAKAQDRMLQQAIDERMEEVAEIMALQATKERQSGE